ncbi:hypothetical protein [Culicoidibacter larvae]|uniref:Uncharacterized protein n=1 Tax=Culicoidibacter larvae TaxID=2579976 RepID=A0A5R8QBY5_9FIRM|nr:hypothetical protein [Culicoidibacter larvae]TLG73854.1 hypothetical protein FEZ08_06885 [Culicoidibacter larvae]
MSNEVLERIDILYDQLAAFLPMEKTELIDYLEEKAKDLSAKHQSKMVVQAELFAVIEELYQDASELKSKNSINKEIDNEENDYEYQSYNTPVENDYVEQEIVIQAQPVYQAKRIPQQKRIGPKIIITLTVVFVICLVLLIFGSYLRVALESMQQYILAALVNGIIASAGLLVFALFFVIAGFIIWEIVQFVKRWMGR